VELVLSGIFMVMLAGTLGGYYWHRQRMDRAANLVLPFSGGYLVRKQRLPLEEGPQEAFVPLYRVVWLPRRTMEGHTVRDVALAAHEAAHGLRFQRGEGWAKAAHYITILRWMLLGSGLTLAFLLHTEASILLLTGAFSLIYLLIPEEHSANQEAMKILQDEGLSEIELEQARQVLDAYHKSYWLTPIAALSILAWQAMVIL
jgi:Zn-dependent membrane protease YugP